MKPLYDVAIIGSGIGGSTLALALAKVGCKVLVVEKSSHPRFAIGESTVLATTVGWGLLSKKYDIPEYRKISRYLSLKKLGLASYPKAHFWFGVHQEGTILEKKHELMFETLPLPMGPDVHLLRSEVDEWLVKRFPRYGIDYTDNTTLSNFKYDADAKLSRFTLEKNTTHEVSAKLVVDASGHAAIMARQFGLMDDPDQMETHTRALYGHFKKVKYLDKICGKNKRFRNKRDAGTLHHCFEGGWIWVIRFNNGTTSIGIMLDTRKYPLDPEISPEEEWQKIIARFPTVAEQFRGAQPITPIKRTGRVQFHTKAMAGDGFIMMPHAASFVEPLFSTGILLTQTFIARFVPIIKKSLKSGDFSADNFQKMSEIFRKEIRVVDKIVNGTIQSFSDFDVFKQYLRVWIYSNTFMFMSLLFSPVGKGLNHIFGSASEKWRTLIDDMYAVVTNATLSREAKEKQLFDLIEKIPNPYDVSDFKPGSKKSTLVSLTMANPKSFRFMSKVILKNKKINGKIDIENALYFVTRMQLMSAEMHSKYTISKLVRGPYSKKIDKMFKLISAKSYPGRKDFYAPFNGPLNARFLKRSK